MRMLKALGITALGLAAWSGVSLAEEPQFKVCKSTYALCTTAVCTKKEGDDTTVSCACDVKTGYSLGARDCDDETASLDSSSLKSRYYPVKSFVSCANDAVWAYCLDKPCTLSDDPTKADCDCTLRSDELSRQPYVIVTDAYRENTCSSGIISSATVQQVFQATEFLKHDGNLPPLDFEVLNVPGR